MGDFDGLVALVTGGSSGIGERTVEVLEQRGARVAILDLQPPAHKGTFFARCDVSSAAEVDAAVNAAVAELGGLDVVVNNAGIGAVGDVSANDDDEWHRVLDVNVVGMARVTRAALPHLRRSNWASIVNTCSVVAVVGLPQRALYSASKGAVAALTLAMAADHLADRIRVNAVTPGTADTPWVGRLLAQSDDAEAAAAALAARQPMGRLVTADEVAQAIVYLASPLASSITGTLLSVDGGLASVRLPAAPPR
jgi:NAD(P)-dependent dehydrogenase (short-subunit alcohol dehydrogenase family)